MQPRDSGARARHGAAPSLSAGKERKLVWVPAGQPAAEPLRFLLGFFANPLYVIGETWLMLFCVVASLASCLLLPSIFSSRLIRPLGFTGQALIAGSAALRARVGIGGIVGLPTTGLAMQLIGRQGLPSSLGLLRWILAVLRMVERRRV